VTTYLDLADYFAIASRETGIPAQDLIAASQPGLADSALHAPQAGFADQDSYPGLPLKTAVLLTRLARNHPLPDGNKRAALLAAIEFVERNGYSWRPPPGDDPGGTETAHVVEQAAAGQLDEDQLARWVADRLVR